MLALVARVLVLLFIGTFASPVSAGFGFLGKKPKPEAPAPVQAEEAPAPPEDPAPAEEPTSAEIPADWLTPALPLSERAMSALASGDWVTAEAEIAAQADSPVSGRDVGDLAFLLGWLQVRLGRTDDAVAVLPALKYTRVAPKAYVHLLTGELLLADKRPVDALKPLREISEADGVVYSRAQIVLAEALHAAGQTEAARDTYIQLAENADGRERALAALAQRAGAGSDAAYPYLRALWAEFPRSEGLRAFASELAATEARDPKRFRPTTDERVQRVEALMWGNDLAGAVREVRGFHKALDAGSEAACRARYVLGRCLYKQNRLTDSIAVLEPNAKACEGFPDAGAPSAYLAGKAQERKKNYIGASQIYALIGDKYPKHSMADDGFTLAGIALQTAGDLSGARALWAEQIDRYPGGDLAGEALWRLAFGAYLAGDPAAALAWTERTLATLTVSEDAKHTLAATYWHARLQAYPDVAAPTVLSEDIEAVTLALDEWAALAASYPGHYYGLLAAARLQELAPERLTEIPEPRWHEVQGPWVVPVAFVDSPEVQRGVALARMGLLGPARAEWARVDPDVLDTGARGFMADQIERAGDFSSAHVLRRAFLFNAPGATLGVNRHQILRAAYADRWTAEVVAATSGDGYDPLLFQGLMREESGYNPRAKSHAGARGLSQLMPATGRSVAGWMGKKVTTAQLYDPVTNLSIGARYLDFLHDHFNGNSLLCLAGYNAGQGNVGKWLKAYGNLPTDEFVERIPFRETRKYVKAVSTSWQIYRLLDPAAQGVFPELSPFNHTAVPDSDPRPVADAAE